MKKALIAAALLSTVVLGACASETKQAENRSTSAKTETPQPVAKTAPDTKTPKTTAKPEVEDAKIVVAEQGYSLTEDGGSDVGVKLQNVGGKKVDTAQVIVNWLDGAGTPIGTESGYAGATDPGGFATVVINGSDVGAAASIHVEAVFKDDDQFMSSVFDDKPLTVTAAEHGDDSMVEYGWHGVKGRVSNPGTEIAESGEVVCLSRDANGAINGGFTTMLDTITPGGEVAWEHATFGHDFATLECTASY